MLLFFFRPHVYGDAPPLTPPVFVTATNVRFEQASAMTNLRLEPDDE
jgi:hypothetical protein